MGERPDPQQVLADAQLATHITVMGDGERSIVVRGNEVAATLALDALAAAGLSVVGEGEARLDGKVVRLDLHSARHHWFAGRCIRCNKSWFDAEDEPCANGRVFVIAPADGGAHG